ncbi:uncharacterized protein LOC125241387 [Leguminivora glycinivorella]|uniref:uncharacterized protein LOC125241387 n=1 Tax=Leguminivora glycinivorella TaxID=1035111 RepID=UPI002010C29F|nr:uncharacterized protein LOC125241387 [Leguminivora glycinivorella]
MSCKVFLVILGSCFIAALAISVHYDGSGEMRGVNNRVWNFDKEELDYDEADDEKHRKGKILFPFGGSIVRFANTECATTSTMSGTCLARRECNDLNGSITGTCASRRGRCCVVSRGCGSSTNVNNTYFTSPGYPAAYAGGTACSIIVNRCSSNICQLRIDFMDMVLAQPDGDGVCATDSITVTGGNTVVPTLCGDNTGQTIFVDFNGDTAVTVTVTATPSTTFSRRWNIKLTQIACDCPGLAPNGCLQYYTGVTGTITSFNYGTAANTALSASLVTGTRQIANLNYGICIRMEAGYCSIQYAQTANIYSFTVTGDVEGADNTVLGTPVGAVNDGACTTDFVVIPNPTVVATGLAVGTDRFCGLGFVPVQTGAKPFVLYVVTDGSEGATAATPPDVANRGFSLAYTQIAC